MIEAGPRWLEVRDRGGSRVRIGDLRRPYQDDLLSCRVTLQGVGMAAGQTVKTFGDGGLVAWLEGLAALYRGWDGVRSWDSLERELQLAATHDGRREVALTATLRGPKGYAPAWTASATVHLEPGEELRRLAREVADLLS